MLEKARLSSRFAFWRKACGAFLLALGVLLFLLVFASLAWGQMAGAGKGGSTPKASNPITIPREAHALRLTLLREARQVWGLAAPTASFAAQIHQESRWRADARSPVGAQGLAQFMPATAAWMPSVDSSLRGSDWRNPTWQIRALVVYDKWLYAKTPAANACEQMAFALASYNGGLGWTLKRRARSAEPLLCMGSTCTINPGVSPASQRENQHYPERILRELEPIYAATLGWGAGSCS